MLVRELETEDYLVISTPMHNLTIPSSLKAWIDHVVRPPDLHDRCRRKGRYARGSSGIRRHCLRRPIFRRAGASAGFPDALFDDHSGDLDCAT
ncbi:NAD(P)H-dependent oxidoreductase [Rhizobium sp. 42MFCr.1]|uniref:NAD(P)H-dependent oxidoreductase n=1 Tax=Rhizobium sp. 42MFCr.1 TaxID=1048680 RepID=UPI001FDA9896|nr:NAD(P)H-dependent oxidoreductase [Rhizobium sp. 42MFCr.1]